MTTRTWMYCRQDDGVFDGSSIASNDPDFDIGRNTPAGMIAVDASMVTDWRSQRRDPETGQVVDYIPPQPDDEHEWDSESKRWVMKPEMQERIYHLASVRAQIEAIEKKMARPLSELLSPTTDDATKTIAQAKLDELVAERDRIAITSGLRQSPETT